MSTATTPSWRDDARTVAPALLAGRPLALAPVSLATWRALGQIVVGWVWLMVAGIVAITTVSTSVGTVPAFGIGLAMLAGTLWLAHGFAVAETVRLSAQTGLGIDVAPRRRPTGPGPWRAGRALLGDGGCWAASAYAAIGLITSTAAFAIVVGLYAALPAAIGAALARWAVAAHDDRPWSHLVAFVLLGVVAAWLAGLLVQVSALVHVRLARALLSRPRGSVAVELAERERAAARQAQVVAEERADHLVRTREQAVGAADDDRRRIERDLHDGAQQRLVALGVELGAARRRAATDPDVVLAALDHAHIEVKETLAELRDLVRGIHPAVLTDRGLDAALSALAARSPVPVTVSVADPDAVGACGVAAGAAAYFVVAEALTNVAKHAGARSARVDVSCPQGVLRVRVEDDGCGGAQPQQGGGLDGLQARIAALDGTFCLVSPIGGPTVLTVEVPCAS